MTATPRTVHAARPDSPRRGSGVLESLVCLCQWHGAQRAGVDLVLLVTADPDAVTCKRCQARIEQA